MSSKNAVSIEGAIKWQIAGKALLAAGTTAALASALEVQGYGNFYEPFMQTLLSLGGPTALGTALVTLVDGGKAKDPLMTSVVVGGVTIGLLMFAGALPMVVDAQTLGTLGVVSVGVYVAELVVN